MNIKSRMLELSCLGALFQQGKSHSWVECTDYDINKAIVDNSYSESDCSGWARSWGNYGSTAFGEDRGAHDDITTDDYMCTDTIGDPTNDYSSTYSDDYPMAEYTVGETVRLLWPAKNHANYECKSNQLDDVMKLFVNIEPNPTSDLGRSTSEWTLVIDWHEESGATFVDSATDGDESVRSTIGVDGVPFQNCPYFCDDEDLAVCFGDFTVPNIFPEDAIYTFVWYWGFKSNEIYSHCFEASITGTQSVTTDDGNGNGNDNGNGTSNANENDSSTTDGEAAATVFITVLIVVLLIIFAIGICIVLQKKGFIVCNENSIEWKGNNNKIAGQQQQQIQQNVVQTTTATNIVRADTNDGPPPPPPSTGATTGGPPPPPRV